MLRDRRLLAELVIVLVVAIGAGAIGFAVAPRPTATSSGDVEAHKATVRRLLDEGFNQGKDDILDTIYAADYVGHIAPTETTRLQITVTDYREFIRLMRTAFPDLRLTTDILIGEGDWVAHRTVLHGTFQSELYDTPPTGNPVEISFNVIHRFDSSGKIVEDWIEYDNLSLQSQLGVISLPPSDE